MVKYATSGFPSLIRLTRESCLCTCERGGLQREREIRKKERKRDTDKDHKHKDTTTKKEKSKLKLTRDLNWGKQNNVR